MTTLMTLYVVAGAFLAVLAVPFLFDKVPPNPFYGFRLGQTLDDPDLWYATNRHFAKRLVVIGLATAATAAGLWFVPGISLDAYALGCLAVFAVVFGVGMAQTVAYMRSLQRAGGGADPAERR